MAAVGHLGFWFLSILIIPPCSHYGFFRIVKFDVTSSWISILSILIISACLDWRFLGACQIWQLKLKPFRSYGFITEIEDGGWWPSWSLVFVNLIISACLDWRFLGPSLIWHFKLNPFTVMKFKTAAGGELEFWFLPILIIPPCPYCGFLGQCQIWQF